VFLGFSEGTFASHEEKSCASHAHPPSMKQSSVWVYADRLIKISMMKWCIKPLETLQIVLCHIAYLPSGMADDLHISKPYSYSPSVFGIVVVSGTPPWIETNRI
jgi:hypothetical protein